MRSTRAPMDNATRPIMEASSNRDHLRSCLLSSYTPAYMLTSMAHTQALSAVCHANSCQQTDPALS